MLRARPVKVRMEGVRSGGEGRKATQPSWLPEDQLLCAVSTSSKRVLEQASPSEKARERKRERERERRENREREREGPKEEEQWMKKRRHVSRLPGPSPDF
ncbi:unnamed protein product [Closterium sp. NIES-65]|nr:unnamed protein product [Closterium sp. NIES-65]